MSNIINPTSTLIKTTHVRSYQSLPSITRHLLDQLIGGTISIILVLSTFNNLTTDE